MLTVAIMRQSALIRALQLLKSTAAPAAGAAQSVYLKGFSLAGRTTLTQPPATISSAASLGAALRRAAWSQAQQATFSCGRGAAATGTTAAAGRQTQQVRSFSRYLQFPGRGSGGGGGRELDPDSVMKALIAVNAGVFLLWRSDPQLCWKHFTVSIDSLRQGRLHTALTAAFSHQDFWHLAANMIGLYFFGLDVGRRFGGTKLLMLYVAGGIAGSLAHCGWYYYQACKRNQGRFARHHFFSFAPPALGASASVNAVMVVDILLFPSRTILLYGLIPMPAALLGVLWLLRDVTGTMEGKGHIAHAGHLGGAAVGALFFAAFRMGRIRPRGWY